MKTESSFKQSLRIRLEKKIMVYYNTIWRDQRQETDFVTKWLNNFSDDLEDQEFSEKDHALYLLSKFMYFGNKEMRALMKCLFRDKYKYPIVEKIRKENCDTVDFLFIENEFKDQLNKTRFLGVGNPAESGIHLLYYFRQENSLPRSVFINAFEIFNRQQDMVLSLADPLIRRYIFIDDFSGSGSQAKRYSDQIVEQIKSIDETIQIDYMALFITEHAREHMSANTKFNNIESIFTLDSSFKCFDEKSRYFMHTEPEINFDFAKDMCNKYGLSLYKSHPLGHSNSQLLIGFFHNTPNNSLPIFWSSKEWNPIFKRYSKLYK